MYKCSYIGLMVFLVLSQNSYTMDGNNKQAPANHSIMRWVVGVLWGTEEKNVLGVSKNASKPENPVMDYKSPQQAAADKVPVRPKMSDEEQAAYNTAMSKLYYLHPNGPLVPNEADKNGAFLDESQKSQSVDRSTLKISLSSCCPHCH